MGLVALSMWNLPRLKIELGPLHWERGRFLITGPIFFTVLNSFLHEHDFFPITVKQKISIRS